MKPRPRRPAGGLFWGGAIYAATAMARLTLTGLLCVITPAGWHSGRSIRDNHLFRHGPRRAHVGSVNIPARPPLLMARQVTTLRAIDAETAGRPLGGDTGGGWVQPIVKESLSDAAYHAIRNALMEGHLRPGETLSLRPMSARFGISVTPMREALLRLVSTNALVMDDRGTAMVPDLTRSEMQDICEIRAELEGRAIVATIARITNAEIDDLVQINDRIIAHVQAKVPAESLKANTRFHLALAGLSGKPVLVDMIESLWIRSGPLLWHSYDREAPRWTPDKHLRILDALRNRDADAARRALSGEILDGMTGYLKFAAPDPDPDPAPEPAPAPGPASEPGNGAGRAAPPGLAANTRNATAPVPEPPPKG